MNKSHIALSDDEAEIYDRQIRLWGVDAQSALRNSKVILLGISCLTTEVIKTLALTGVGHISIVDDREINATMLNGCFFISTPDVGKNRGKHVSEVISKMNSFCQFQSFCLDPECLLNPHSLSKLNGFPSLVDYNHVILFNLNPFLVSSFGSFCRAHKIPITVAESHSRFSFFISDLGSIFRYDLSAEEVGNDAVDDEVIEIKKETFCEGCGKRSKIDENVEKEQTKKIPEETENSDDDVIFEEEMTQRIEQERKSNLSISYSPLHEILPKESPASSSFRYSSLNEKGSFSKAKNFVSKIREAHHQFIAAYPQPSSSSSSPFSIPATFLPDEPTASHMNSLVGAILGQDIVKSITHTKRPINNLFIMDLEAYGVELELT